MLTVNTLLCPHVAAMHAKYTRVCKEIERLTQNTTKEMPVYFVKAQFYSTNSRICMYPLSTFLSRHAAVTLLNDLW